MLKELSQYDNLGSPEYFFQLFVYIKEQNNANWTIKDAEKLFYNKIIEGKSIFDGCLPLATKISIIIENENGKISLNEKFTDFLFSEKQMSDKFVEYLFLAVYQDEIFNKIFSPEHFTYDILTHSPQINNSAFGFKYANFKQLLLDFNILQVHPLEEIKKYILNSRYKKIFDKIILPQIKKRKIGINQLKDSLEEQQVNGEEAEKFVLKFEKDRLENKEGIDWVAEYSVAEGYDISSFEDKNSIINNRFIEVKSYINQPYFYWSRNEMDIAKIKTNEYYIYLVDRNKMKDNGYKPIIIQNPFQNVYKNETKWDSQIEKMKFKLKI